MNKPFKNNRNIILILFAMSVIPFMIAWYLAEHPEWFNASTNRGELIRPVITTERNELEGRDTFSAENITELKGHWVLLNIVSKKPCQHDCLEAIHKTRQLRLMMNKDLTRIRRAVIFLAEVNSENLAPLWKDDQRILRLKAKPALAKKLRLLIQEAPGNGWLILMDPLGNLMMKYRSGFDPYDVKKDLAKLLRISQIG